MKALRRVVLSFMCLAASAAHADLFSAHQAYEKQDYETAFKLYKDLAELGQVRAQEYVAAMYVAGEGVKRNNLLGYAWASIAIDNGSVGEEMKSIVAQLEPHVTESARKKIDELKAQFGRDGLKKSLLPNIFANGNYIDREPCRISKPEVGIYPIDARNRGIQGNVYVEVTVMPDGRGRNPRVIFSVPAGVFDEAARAALLKTEFTPAKTKQGLVPCTMSMMFRYVMKGYESSDYPKLEVLTKQTREKAEAGDPHAQMLYGFLISGLPQLKMTRSDAMPWFLKSAQAGMSTAQFTVGYSILQGWGCECEEPKGLAWLHMAAAADQADAQVTLANYLLRGEPGPEEVGKATKWLERAVANNHREGKFYLAALLAAGPVAEHRDPARSLALLKDVMREMDVDPTAFEIRAAAHAMQGNFKDALKDQKKALSMAQKLGWEVASQQQRLKSYEGSSTWTGDLFAF